nr:hypothetical protein GCM10017611_12380 [Rhodococcus wratislaviensis]
MQASAAIANIIVHRETKRLDRYTIAQPSGAPYNDAAVTVSAKEESNPRASRIVGSHMENDCPAVE